MPADYFLLWGFSERQPEPIKLSGGTMRECNARRSSREAEGWTCAVYRAGVAPTGLREVSRAR